MVMANVRPQGNVGVTGRVGWGQSRWEHPREHPGGGSRVFGTPTPAFAPATLRAGKTKGRTGARLGLKGWERASVRSAPHRQTAPGLLFSGNSTLDASQAPSPARGCTEDAWPGAKEAATLGQGGEIGVNPPKTQKSWGCPKTRFGRLKPLSKLAGGASLPDELCPLPPGPFAAALVWLMPAPRGCC